jgi:hypothetical protein
MSALIASIEGIGFWTRGLPSWDAARAYVDSGLLPDQPPARPSPQLLAPNERRRAPESGAVALALEVAAAATRDAGLAPESLPSIFTSTHGDLAVNDYMCSTLASAPTLISPTRFHNSVHNAAAGYWTIATGCREASTALTAFDASFGAGLLEAATQACADGRPVLLVAFDVEATGALASVTESSGLLACAFVVGPVESERSIAAFDWSLAGGPALAPALRSAAARSLAGNAMAGALPFLEAIAALPAKDAGEPVALTLPLAPSLGLRLVVRTAARTAAATTP